MNNILDPLDHFTEVGRTVPVSRQEQPKTGRASVPASHISSPLGGEDTGEVSSSNSASSALNSDRLDDLLPLHDLAQEFAKDSPDVFIKAAINIASVDFFTILNRFDTVALTKRLSEKPELYFQLINSFCNLMRIAHEQQKLEHKQKQAEARQRERDQKLRARKPILITATTIASIQSAVGRGVPAEPLMNNVAASRESAIDISSPLRGEDQGEASSDSSASSVLKDPAPLDAELAQIVAAEFAAEEPHSWEDQNREDEDALIASPS